MKSFLGGQMLRPVTVLLLSWYRTAAQAAATYDSSSHNPFVQWKHQDSRAERSSCNAGKESCMRSSPVQAAASYLQRHGHLYEHAQPAHEPDTQPPVTLVVQQIPARETPVSLILLSGIAIGIMLSFAVVGSGCWPWAGRKGDAEASQAGAEAKGDETGPEFAPLALSDGHLLLPHTCYKDDFFRQFNWALDLQRDCIMVTDDRGREAARVVGRLMAAPNGEMHLESEGLVWAVLKRPAPSRRPGQLWKFKVCTGDGSPYAEVRQMSDTKCIVDCANSKRQLLTVVGNFSYPVFLSGERHVRVWFQQDTPYADPGICAQVEATVQEPSSQAEARATTGASSSSAEPPNSVESYKEADKEQQSEKVAQQHRFHVSTTVGVDASLVLAVLVGVQDVHRASQRFADSATRLKDIGPSLSEVQELDQDSQ